MNPSPPNAGFSLIEVMVAILILGIALAGLTHGITTALDSSKQSEQQATAALYAAGMIETLRAETGLQNGETEGDCGAGLEAYHWKQVISDADVEGLHDVDVVIENAQNQQQIFELKTLLFEPASSATAATGANPASAKKGGNPP